ncbi:universal stress protein [Natronorubrum sulfidifaciens]|uniref:UspA domain-containing protein n=1 Tax=Natronorubrum sulfidifaciens JCM 14089 TaxID=1230460 RepID=L9W564_9EURY|nr:universal stress protein [Natronorubrum sulfidifaciens]ELY44609.1 UspA domain-containing protein [Natronorubrum sulfidifaciens JCM 14089]
MSVRLEGIDSVLLPTDGSDRALAGARRGTELAVATGADVHVLSVVDTSEAKPDSSALGRDEDEAVAAIDADADVAVDAVARMVRETAPALEVTTTAERGTPFRVIDSYVEAADIDLIAMGTKGRTGLERVTLGSVTENVLRTVAVPVCAVPLGAADTPLSSTQTETVLLPTDGSDGAAVAVDWGLELATVFDAMVHTLYSVDTSRFPSRTEPTELLSTLEDEGRAALEAVRERAVDAGVSVMGTVASGPPAKVILNYATENEIDLIVIGTHGRSGMTRHLLGSVTENVVRNADVPVVCVPMRGDDRRH